jgi:hypothetical protein
MRSSQPVKIWFVDFWHPETVEAIRANPLFELVNEHFDVVPSERPEVVFYSVFGSRHLQYVCKRIQFVGENQPPNLFAADYTFSFVDVEIDRSFRLPLYRLYRDYQAVRLGPRVGEESGTGKNQGRTTLSRLPRRKFNRSCRVLITHCDRIVAGGQAIL